MVNGHDQMTTKNASNMQVNGFQQSSNSNAFKTSTVWLRTRRSGVRIISGVPVPYVKFDDFESDGFKGFRHKAIACARMTAEELDISLCYKSEIIILESKINISIKLLIVILLLSSSLLTGCFIDQRDNDVPEVTVMPEQTPEQTPEPTPEAVMYTVTLNPNGGVWTDDNTDDNTDAAELLFKEGTDIDADMFPQLRRRTYRLHGWVSETLEFFNNQEAIQGDITLYAVWITNDQFYTLLFLEETLKSVDYFEDTGEIVSELTIDPDRLIVSEIFVSINCLEAEGEDTYVLPGSIYVDSGFTLVIQEGVSFEVGGGITADGGTIINYGNIVCTGTISIINNGKIINEGVIFSGYRGDSDNLFRADIRIFQNGTLENNGYIELDLSKLYIGYRHTEGKTEGHFSNTGEVVLIRHPTYRYNTGISVDFGSFTNTGTIILNGCELPVHPDAEFINEGIIRR